MIAAQSLCELIASIMPELGERLLQVVAEPQ